MENEILNFTISVKEYKTWLEGLNKKVEGTPDDKLITVSFTEQEDGIETKVFETQLEIHPEIYDRVTGYYRARESFHASKRLETSSRKRFDETQIQDAMQHEDNEKGKKVKEQTK